MQRPGQRETRPGPVETEAAPKDSWPICKHFDHQKGMISGETVSKALGVCMCVEAPVCWETTFILFQVTPTGYSLVTKGG